MIFHANPIVFGDEKYFFVCNNYISFIKIRRIVNVPLWNVYNLSHLRKEIYSEESVEKQMETSLFYDSCGGNGFYYASGRYTGCYIIISQ